MKKNNFNNLDNVFAHAKILAKMNNFGLAITEHQNHINNIVSVNKSHLKKIFKYCRFDVINKMLLIYFTEKKPTIKKLKELVINEGGVSINSLTAFVDYLHFSKYITFEKNENDKRCLLFYPTADLFNLMSELLRSFAIPYINLTKKENFEINIEKFYKNYKKLLYNGLKPLNNNLEANIFLNHDSGHLIMLKIYTEYVKSNGYNLKLSQTELAKYTSTSRTHIKSILSNAYRNGVIIKNGDKIILSSRFKCACEKYFSLHMAIISFCLE